MLSPKCGTYRGEAGMKGLPIAQFPVATSVGSMFYVVTTADQRGRLADRSPLRVLGGRRARRSRSGLGHGFVDEI